MPPIEGSGGGDGLTSGPPPFPPPPPNYDSGDLSLNYNNEFSRDLLITLGLFWCDLDSDII